MTTTASTSTEGIRIHKIRIRDFRGVEALDVDVPPAGVIVRGECRSGKTSVLKAILAALTAQDVGPDAIRHGAGHAEIFVDLDALTVKRSIDSEGSTVNASSAIPHSKQRAKIGQKRLDELFGRGVSPMALFRGKPEERRKIVMSAMPMRLEDRHLAEWLTDEQRASLPPAVVQAIPLAHGLEAVALLHKHLYDARARANADAKGQKGKADHAAADARSRGDIFVTEEAVEEAAKGKAAAQRAVDAMLAQADSAEAFEQRTAATRQKIAEKRAGATRKLAEVQVQVDLEPLDDACRDAEEVVSAIKRRLDEAIEDLRQAACARAAAKASNERRTAAVDAAQREHEAASELEASLSGATAPAPTEADRAAVGERLVEAEAAYAEAVRRNGARMAHERAEKEAAELARLEALAAGLTATVDHLRTQAPAQLLRESEGIPGLGLDDGELTVDGVRLDGLSGAELLRLCVDVAKRASRQRGGEGRVLITDGLEALDPKTLRSFVRLATSDGWQLLATRVTEGDLTVEAIELETEAEAAQ